MLGFGKGKIEIKIENFNYSPGETIKGDISLYVKKTQKARGVIIELIGQQKTSRMINSIGTQGSMQQNTSTQKIYNFKQQLDGEKEYSGEYNYNFQIKIPQNIYSNSNTILNSVTKSLQALSNQYSQISWYLIAKLDITWGIDISKKVQINIR